MNYTQYQGEIWRGPAVQPELWKLLLEKDLLIELSAGQPPYAVVLGVPHHAGPGEERIAEGWMNPKTGRYGRPADETSGLAGLLAFSALREKGCACRLVIAAHPMEHDPNKTPESAYWQRVFDPGSLPGMLFELHGAKKDRRHALELSAGMNDRAGALDFGRRLAEGLDPTWSLAVQAQYGTQEAWVVQDRVWSRGRLQNPGLGTLSLLYAGQVGIPALHLEMKPMFRQPVKHLVSEVRPPEAGWRLARALAAALVSKAGVR